MIALKYLYTDEILPTVQTSGESAFAGCKSLTQFIVDEGAGFVTTNDGKLLLTKDHTTLIAATYNLEGALTLPGSLTKISGRAFNGNASLTSITLPMGLTEIGDEAFKETKLTAITIPASVKTIGEHAFQSARVLSTVNFNNGLETIKAGAFYNCSSLGYVTLPNTVKYVGEHVFESTLCKVVINFEHTNGFTVFENSFPLSVRRKRFFVVVGLMMCVLFVYYASVLRCTTLTNKKATIFCKYLRYLSLLRG